MANNADTLQRAYDNYCRIFVLVTEQILNPTQGNLDTLTSSIEGAGVVQPNITTTVDGEVYNWTEYQQALEGIMAGIRRQMVFAAGPFETRSIIR